MFPFTSSNLFDNFIYPTSLYISFIFVKILSWFIVDVHKFWKKILIHHTTVYIIENYTEIGHRLIVIHWNKDVPTISWSYKDLYIQKQQLLLQPENDNALWYHFTLIWLLYTYVIYNANKKERIFFYSLVAFLN